MWATWHFHIQCYQVCYAAFSVCVCERSDQFLLDLFVLSIAIFYRFLFLLPLHFRYIKLASSSFWVHIKIARRIISYYTHRRINDVIVQSCELWQKLIWSWKIDAAIAMCCVFADDYDRMQTVVTADAVVTGKTVCDGDNEEAGWNEYPILQLASDVTCQWRRSNWTWPRSCRKGMTATLMGHTCMSVHVWTCGLYLCITV